MKRKKCVRRYMARKVWRGLVESLKYLALALFCLAIFVGIAYLIEQFPIAGLLLKWAVFGFVGLVILLATIGSVIELYDEARRECGCERN